MKIFALNGSPRKESSNTDRLLLPFLDGAKEEGAEVDLVYLQKHKIGPCLGCFHCWLKTPGQCVQKDDMTGLLERMKQADVLVCATPLYVCGMSAQMKAFFDRFIPIAEPFIEIRNDVCAHPSRYERQWTGVVLISNCGFHELLHFNELVDHIKAICRVSDMDYLGSLLRPHGEIMAMAEQLMPDQINRVYEAAREAGRMAARKEPISKEVEKAFTAELINRDDYLKGANAYFQSELDKVKAA
jgi:multimeric flavodoxin WrbA